MATRILSAVAVAAAFFLLSPPGQAHNPDQARQGLGLKPQQGLDQAQQMMADLNTELAAMGLDMQVAVIEYLTSGDGDEIGRTVFFSDRGNKMLGSDWVPGDPRRGGGTDITWIIDEFDFTLDVSSVAVSSAAITRAMDTWQAETCSDIPLTSKGTTASDAGVIQWIFGFGGSPPFPIPADVVHAGWLPGAFFDILAPGGGSFILAVTFTSIWVDVSDPANIIPTDIDHNFRTDTASREIYYNDNFPWADGNHFDIETVALHEVGHGLSQGHFGEVFLSPGNNRLHFDPRAVMNASYSGIQTELTGTDAGGHCANWASWPDR